MPNFSELQDFFQKYFPGEPGPARLDRFRIVFGLYPEWNEKINVISRKDIENLAGRHFLHSLAIAKVIRFRPGTRVLDAGTGGGFPGLPLALFFPEVQFHLVDSRAKKIRVVQEIVQAAGLGNVQYSVQRVEQLREQYDFVLSRAVAPMDRFLPWVRKRIHCRSRNSLPNGILYLRGGDVRAEMTALGRDDLSWTVFPLAELFEEAFFREKSLLHVTFCKP